MTRIPMSIEALTRIFAEHAGRMARGARAIERARMLRMYKIFYDNEEGLENLEVYILSEGKVYLFTTAYSIQLSFSEIRKLLTNIEPSIYG